MSNSHMTESTDPQAVFDCIARGDIERLRELIKEDPQRARSRNQAGLRPLMLALYYQQQAIVDAC